ncbi:probable indole-3-pyruvate monooxygenase YUCCA10 isoform X2 [Syzygium oleosum]|uniref:probable indole-3-pyruvate monooxygenase YUCCA10 isoform X2 n=1 Tax=Syzygium oleosum TaxID=219896 RepID=UPI0024BA2016|nr:probable indole-3-pyruvate monooxygenase YUCCA10 isoform X2 [Syzygium oleosum]
MNEEAEVIIVGGGPSGIAAAGALSSLSIPFLLLERADCFAPLWQRHAYDRLHIHLPKHTCQLPHVPIPADWPKYPPKSLFVQYLQHYVAHFHISPVYNRSVESARYDDASGRWRVAARDVSASGEGAVEEYSARFLVVATGERCDAFVPEVEGLGSFGGKAMHSTEYKNGKEFAKKKVLVVGSGNSGMEIALDLADHGAITSIVVRSPVNFVTREMLNWAVVMVKYLSFNWAERLTMITSRLWFGDMSKFGIPKPEEGPFTMKMKYGKYPLVDVGTCKKIRCGEIQVLPAVKSIKGNEVVFENGHSHSFDAIVFATGFKRSTKQWLKEEDCLLNDDGIVKPSCPNKWKGKNGLYCVGLSRRGFLGAALDAQSVANDIKGLL